MICRIPNQGNNESMKMTILIINSDIFSTARNGSKQTKRYFGNMLDLERQDIGQAKNSKNIQNLLKVSFFPKKVNER